MQGNKNLLALHEIGQSIWYDNCSRDVLQSGELASLIEAGVSGLTSNPTIFQKAIGETSHYDDDIKELAKKGLSSEEVCEELMIQDVAAAADLLLPLFQSTQGGDGYASIEVSPFLADNTESTLQAAERIWKKLDRPNVMIKIPATPEGIPAIESCIEQGINVNITLIFSVAVYEQVINAYLAGLEKRGKAKSDISSVASVASFFISRVDSLFEKQMAQLQEKGKFSEEQVAELRDSALGKVGIANSKVAYSLFEELFHGPRFQKLQEQGARFQRPLWASTSTKNPEFSPVLYVEELAGKFTVNTLPPKTLYAVMENAVIEPRLESGLSEAKKILSILPSYEIVLEDLLYELQVAGVKSFSDSYRQLLQAIDEKSRSLQ